MKIEEKGSPHNAKKGWPVQHGPAVCQRLLCTLVNIHNTHTPLHISKGRHSLKTHLAPIVTVTHRMMVHKARQSTGHVHRATYGHLSQQPFTASFLE